MKYNSTAILCTAPAGSGKTYYRCAVFLGDTFLREPGGCSYSNFPVNVGEMAAYVKKRWGVPEEHTVARIKLIPREVLLTWERGESGPWDYFDGKDISGAHISIDEAHRYIARSTPVAIRRQWQRWLGELRHYGACCEFLSQHLQKLGREVVQECAVRIILSSDVVERDPLFGVPIGDWYQFTAWWRGTYRAGIRIVEKQQVEERWKVSHRERMPLEERYFRLYDSFNVDEGGTSGEAAEVWREGFRAVMGWFLRRHWFRVGWKMGLGLAVCWMCFGGGTKYAVKGWVWAVERMVFSGGGGSVEVEPVGPVEVEPVAAVESVAPVESVEPVEPVEPMRRATPRKRVTGRPESGKLGSGPGLPGLSDAGDVVGGWIGRDREVEVDNVQYCLAEAVTVAKGHYRISAVGEDWVLFGTGERVPVGSQIKEGALAGRWVAGVNMAARKVYLNEGTILTYRAGAIVGRRREVVR